MLAMDTEVSGLHRIVLVRCVHCYSSDGGEGWGWSHIWKAWGVASDNPKNREKQVVNFVVYMLTLEMNNIHHNGYLYHDL